MKKSLPRVCAVFLVLFLLVGSCTKDAPKDQQQRHSTEASAPEADIIRTADKPSSPAVSGGGDFKNVIIEVARKNIPAVVHIEVTQTQEVASPFSPFENDPLFRHFFEFRQSPRKFKRELKGIGTTPSCWVCIGPSRPSTHASTRGSRRCSFPVRAVRRQNPSPMKPAASKPPACWGHRRAKRWDTNRYSPT